MDNTLFSNASAFQESSNGFINSVNGTSSCSSPTNMISTLLERKILRATSANFSGNNGKAAGLVANSLIF